MGLLTDIGLYGLYKLSERKGEKDTVDQLNKHPDHFHYLTEDIDFRNGSIIDSINFEITNDKDDIVYDAREKFFSLKKTVIITKGKTEVARIQKKIVPVKHVPLSEEKEVEKYSVSYDGLDETIKFYKEAPGLFNETVDHKVHVDTEESTDVIEYHATRRKALEYEVNDQDGKTVMKVYIHLKKCIFDVYPGADKLKCLVFGLTLLTYEADH